MFLAYVLVVGDELPKPAWPLWAERVDAHFSWLDERRSICAIRLCHEDDPRRPWPPPVA